MNSLDIMFLGRAAIIVVSHSVAWGSIVAHVFMKRAGLVDVLPDRWRLALETVAIASMMLLPTWGFIALGVDATSMSLFRAEATTTGLFGLVASIAGTVAKRRLMRRRQGEAVSKT